MRAEEYRLSSGDWSPHRKDAALVSAEDVVAAVAHVRAGGMRLAIPDKYFVATAEHESGRAINERDTEESGFQSWGIYQVSTEEAVAVGHRVSPEKLLTLDESTAVFALLSQGRLNALNGALKCRPPDVWAYLALAHNQGMHAARATIVRYGCNWEAYKVRNPACRLVTSGYGDDVGGRA